MKVVSTTKTGAITIANTVKAGGKTYKVTAIADKAFSKNTKLTKVTMTGSNLITIGASAFNGCTKLTTVTIGANVTTIGVSAFGGCTKLTTVTIGANVTKIGDKAFYGDSKLTTITFKGSKLKTVGTQAFKNTKSKAVTVKAPKAKLTAYEELLKKAGLTAKAYKAS